MKLTEERAREILEETVINFLRGYGIEDHEIIDSWTESAWDNVDGGDYSEAEIKEIYAEWLKYGKEYIEDYL